MPRLAAIVILLFVLGCGDGAEESAMPPQGVEALELRLESLHPTPPANPYTQIGLTRRWIPKDVDGQSVQVTVRMLVSRLGMRDPDPPVGDTEDITKDGLRYEVWSALGLM